MTDKTILISINASWNIVNFRSGLVRALIDRGYKVIAAAPFDDYTPRLRQLGCEYVEIPIDSKGSSPVRDVVLFLRYYRLMRRFRPSVYLGYTIKPNIYGSLAAHAIGIPVVNNVAGLGTVFVQRNWMTRLVRGMYWAAFLRSRTVFFQNDEDRTLFVGASLVAPEKTKVLPGSGVDLKKFQPRQQQFEPHQSKAPLFLLLSRILWDKGVGYYVDAARILKERFPDARFQLLGFLDVDNRTAISRDQIQAWVDEGVIEYLGSTDDVRPPIAAASCVVLPSYYAEGTPRTLLEAAAMGKPLITTDAPGCRNVVDHGSNGFLCRTRDSEDLARAMERFILLSDAERTEMGLASRRKVEAEYDERFVIEHYLDAIRKETPKKIGGTRQHCWQNQ